MRKLKTFDGRKPFLKPERPFILIYEDRQDGMSIAWLKTEKDMIEVVEEVTSYGCAIIDAIEIGCCRNIIIE